MAAFLLYPSVLVFLEYWSWLSIHLPFSFQFLKTSFILLFQLQILLIPLSLPSRLPYFTVCFLFWNLSFVFLFF